MNSGMNTDAKIAHLGSSPGMMMSKIAITRIAR